MGYLTKQQYERRRENAVARNIKNGEVAVANGMTQEQAELISELCSMRHNLHSNIEHLVYDSSKELRELIELNIRLKDSGLEPMDFVPLDAYDEFASIDYIDVLLEMEDVPEDEEGRKEWYTDKTFMIHEQWDELNRKIEAYIARIDEKYNTKYAPTGALRIF